MTDEERLYFPVSPNSKSPEKPSQERLEHLGHPSRYAMLIRQTSDFDSSPFNHYPTAVIINVFEIATAAIEVASCAERMFFSTVL